MHKHKRYHMFHSTFRRALQAKGQLPPFDRQPKAAAAVPEKVIIVYRNYLSISLSKIYEPPIKQCHCAQDTFSILARAPKRTSPEKLKPLAVHPSENSSSAAVKFVPHGQSPEVSSPLQGSLKNAPPSSVHASDDYAYLGYAMDPDVPARSSSCASGLGGLDG
jgi:hypothetical protein